MSALDYGQPPAATVIQSNIRRLLAHLLASPRFKVGWTASVSRLLLACCQLSPSATGGRVQLASHMWCTSKGWTALVLCPPRGVPTSRQLAPMLQSRGGRDFAVTLTHPVLPWGPWAAQVREGGGCTSYHRRRCCTMHLLGRPDYSEHGRHLLPCHSCAPKRGSGTLSTCWLKWGRHACGASGRMLGEAWSFCHMSQASQQPTNRGQGAAARQGGRLFRTGQERWLAWLLRGVSTVTSAPCFQWLTWTYHSQSWARTAPPSCTCEVRSVLGVRPAATWAMLLPACTLQLSSCRCSPSLATAGGCQRLPERHTPGTRLREAIVAQLATVAPDVQVSGS